MSVAADKLIKSGNFHFHSVFFLISNLCLVFVLFIHVLLSVKRYCATNKVHVHYLSLAFLPGEESVLPLYQEVQEYLCVGPELMHIDSPAGGDRVCAGGGRIGVSCCSSACGRRRGIKNRNGSGQEVNLGAAEVQRLRRKFM